MHASKTKLKNTWFLLAVLFLSNYWSFSAVNAMNIRQQSASSDISTSLMNEKATAPKVKASVPKVANIKEFVAHANSAVPFTSA